MTVLEYFDYEKKLLEDFNSVKTQHAKDAVYAALLKVLSDHKTFVLNTIKKFETDVQESAKQAVQVYKGEAPDYVKKLMAEFGFYELEECDDFGRPSGVIHMKKDIRHKLKSLCKTDDDNCMTEKFSPPVNEKISDKEYDRRNAKIMSLNDPGNENFNLGPEQILIEDFLKPGSNNKNKKDDCSSDKKKSGKKQKIRKSGSKNKKA